ATGAPPATTPAVPATSPPQQTSPPTTTSNTTTPGGGSTTTTTAPGQLLPPPAAPLAQPAMVMRSAWGGDLGWNWTDCPAGISYSPMLKFAVVHHTVNANDYTDVQSAGIVRAIWAYHVQTLHYCDIAYNFLVDRFGTIFEGRMGGVTKPVLAAHSGGF